MKKIIYLLVFVFMTLGCSKDDRTEIIEANLTAVNCNLLLPNPFTEQTITYGSISSGCDGVYDPGDADIACFYEELRIKINKEYARRLSMSNRPTSVASGESGNSWGGTEEGSFDTLGVPDGNFYPFIDASDANIIIEEVICNMDTYFSTLPTLSGNRIYHPIIEYLRIDFQFSGPDADGSFISIYYETGILQ